MKILLLIWGLGLNCIKNPYTLHIFIRDLRDCHRNRVKYITCIPTRIDNKIIHRPAIDRHEIGIRPINKCERIVITRRRKTLLFVMNDILRRVLCKPQRKINLCYGNRRIE